MALHGPARAGHVAVVHTGHAAVVHASHTAVAHTGHVAVVRAAHAAVVHAHIAHGNERPWINGWDRGLQAFANSQGAP
ncbi:hypothetical protein D3C76_1369920 [compost metagenome]